MKQMTISPANFGIDRFKKHGSLFKNRLGEGVQVHLHIGLFKHHRLHALAFLHCVLPIAAISWKRQNPFMKVVYVREGRQMLVWYRNRNCMYMSFCEFCVHFLCAKCGSVRQKPVC